MTGVLAALFFATSLGLAYLATQQTAPTTLLETAPAQSAAPPPVAEPEPASDVPVIQSEPAVEPAPAPE
jgi:preprotein translocase subunit SecG